MKQKKALALFLASLLVLLTGFTTDTTFYSEPEVETEFSVGEGIFGSEQSQASPFEAEESLFFGEEGFSSEEPLLPPVGDTLYDNDTGFEYEFQEGSDTNIFITGYRGSMTSLIIPSTITMNKYVIVGIRQGAFKGNRMISSLDITNTSIVTIGSNAFQDCVNLNKAELSPTLSSIGEYAFANTGITSIVIPPSVLSISRTAFAYTVRIGGVNGSYAALFCQQAGNPFFPVSADPNRTTPYTPKVSSIEDGYEVRGLDTPIIFPNDGYHIFTVKGASAVYLYQDKLVQEDGRWVPIYWVFDGSATKHDEVNNTSTILDPVTFTLYSEDVKHHTVGGHNILIYFRLYYWNAANSMWLPTETINATSVSYSIPQPTNTPTPIPTPTATFTPTPVYTSTPVPTATHTPAPTATLTPEPSVTVTLTPGVSSTPTSSPTISPTPTVTPFNSRLPFSPKVDSVDHGFTVTGLEKPLELPAGKTHTFKVTGASATAVYGTELITGDAKWVPIYWTNEINSAVHNNQVAEGANEDINPAVWTLRSEKGYYGRSGDTTIYLYFRRYQYNEGVWEATTEISYVPYMFTIAKITPTPTPTNTPTPTLTPTVTPTPVPVEGDLILTPTKKTLYVGAASKYSKLTLDVALGGDLEGSTVKYKSSNKEVASVSKKGVVKALSAGKSTITAYVKISGQTFKDKCKITVKNPTLTLSSETVTLSVGGTMSFKATAKPATTIDYSSTDKSIATITNKGVITGIAPGSCDIWIKANGLTKILGVTVTEK